MPRLPGDCGLAERSCGGAARAGIHNDLASMVHIGALGLAGNETYGFRNSPPVWAPSPIVHV
jgi:hypothetical protein